MKPFALPIALPPALRSLLLSLGTACALLLGSGCVIARSVPPDPRWPTAVKAPELRRFDGIYRDNGGFAGPAGSAKSQLSLFAFATGRRRLPRVPAPRVEIRTSPDGRSLRLRQFGDGGQTLAEVVLHRDSDFRFEGDILEVGRSAAGVRGTSGNLGAGVLEERSELRLDSGGGLLGRLSSRSAGLLFFVVPLATSSERSIRWQRVGQ